MIKSIKKYKIKSVKITKLDYKNIKKLNKKKINKEYYIEKYLNKEAELNSREKNVNKLIKKFYLDYEEANNIYDKWKEEFMKAKFIKE